jgi:hypothetical protein
MFWTANKWSWKDLLRTSSWWVESHSKSKPDSLKSKKKSIRSILKKSSWKAIRSKCTCRNFPPMTLKFWSQNLTIKKIYKPILRILWRTNLCSIPRISEGSMLKSYRRISILTKIITPWWKWSKTKIPIPNRILSSIISLKNLLKSSRLCLRQ